MTSKGRPPKIEALLEEGTLNPTPEQVHDPKFRENEFFDALPLTEDELAIVKKDVLARMGTLTAVNFRVDPSILGGLIIYAGDKVLDGSVAGQLEDLHKSLK